jgi:hypothetical protein
MKVIKMATKDLVLQSLRKVKRLFFQINNPHLEFRFKLLKKMPKLAICAEIGVWKGTFSKHILRTTKPKKLHLIDPWVFQSEYPERLYGGIAAKSQADMDQIYQSVKSQFDTLPNVLIHRGYSEKVLQEFIDGYFDWLYIDGNHYYEHIRKDLQLAFLKVKPEGFITGDDYSWGGVEGFPVKQAIQDFITEKKIENNLEIVGSQFIIRKP